MKKGKRIIVIFILVLLLLGVVAASFSTVVLADSPATYSVDVTVDLNEDGSAHVTEVWDVNVIDGTEYYLTKYDLLKGQDIRELSVTDETGQTYENIGVWDSDRSGEEKKFQCGLISTKGGYEICWGIYNDYGKHTYMVSYIMDGLVQSYDTVDAVNQTFVADNLAVSPEKVTILLRKVGTSFTSDDTKIWGFGATGDIQLVNGEIELVTSGSNIGTKRVAVLASFEKGMFSPTVESKKSFEKVKEENFKGSNYENESAGRGIDGKFVSFFLFFGFFIVVILFSVLFCGKSVMRKRKIEKKYKQNVIYSREFPWQNSILATNTCLGDLQQLTNQGNIIGVYLLQWIKTRQIDVIQMVPIGAGNTAEIVLQMYAPRGGMPRIEEQLYKMLLKASGPDFVLSSSEFEKWSKGHYEQVRGWFTAVEKLGKTHIINMGACEPAIEKKLFGSKEKELLYNKIGEEYIVQMFGFQKYLQDFTLINEREAREVELWDEYLIYAQIFGIAGQVAKQFEEIYPGRFSAPASQGGYGMNSYDLVRLSYATNHFGCSAKKGSDAGYSAAHSSSGGGGGFSGGGGGSGGSGGGGGGGGSR